MFFKVGHQRCFSGYSSLHNQKWEHRVSLQKHNAPNSNNGSWDLSNMKPWDKMNNLGDVSNVCHFKKWHLSNMKPWAKMNHPVRVITERMLHDWASGMPANKMQNTLPGACLIMFFKVGHQRCFSGCNSQSDMRATCRFKKIMRLIHSTIINESNVRHFKNIMLLIPTTDHEIWATWNLEPKSLVGFG